VTEHQWYQDIVESAESGSLLDNASTIYRYDYKGNYFFEVENSAFSCMHCYIYDCDGNNAGSANSFDVYDFIENRTGRVIIWVGDTALWHVPVPSTWIHYESRMPGRFY
jgi:hypothetical protein